MSVTARERTQDEDRARAVHVGAFRADVEGLRAVAIGLVLLFHAGVTIFSGGFVGVDVFFVISGFLITGQLVGELDRSGRISLVAFYARRARRILPAAGVVLVAAAGITLAVSPRSHVDAIGGDIVASALYLVNWRIKDRLVSGELDAPPFTPVSHYWSLAIEEQFYLFWPVMLILAALAARLVRVRTTRLVALAVVVVAVVSFAWSVRNTANSPHTAYFSTFTRMHELAIGGCLALAGTALTRLSRPVALVLGWAGLLAVAVSGIAFTLDSAWPGYLAAVPTLGTAAIIAAGFANPRGGPAGLLGTAPMRWVGRLSYSLYLWHWAVLYLAALAFGGLAWYVSAGAVAVSVVLAWLTYTLVENPIRRSAAVNRSPRLAIGVGLSFTLLGTGAGLLVTLA